MGNEVLLHVSDNGVATLTLNRPQALNSLTYEMIVTIGEALRVWEDDDQVRMIVMKGAGTKGLCAGGDIKALYEARSSHRALKEAECFFEAEYQVDQLMYAFPKPIIAILDGIVMGGGVGLTYGARYRIVTEQTKWAMPEMNIGFFPDVGAAYFLNKAPGITGLYLALTASVIQAADVLYIHGAEYYMSSEKLSAFLNELETMELDGTQVESALQQLINKHSESAPEQGELAAIQHQIDECFSLGTMEEIIGHLDSTDNEFARKIKEILLSKSPSSLKITLKQIADGKRKSIEECFATDLILAKNFLRHPDFFEGVRSVLIDKDRNPRYTYQELSSFSAELVDEFFRERTDEDRE
ncbi:enoyl-CoA hydratase/isomerase family protein [Brevibacillus reuszeri]|uniref:enoyl-CoA hydratase/isomerase family protein n=1 Tax=Brevibacillus reuszeri TaxID=54915 RepID=UPI002898AFC5|nr:enoyl-CoA hydratase/isomerase family protein [Brevibacillus reuszeri]